MFFSFSSKQMDGLSLVFWWYSHPLHNPVLVKIQKQFYYPIDETTMRLI